MQAKHSDHHGHYYQLLWNYTLDPTYNPLGKLVVDLRSIMTHDHDTICQLKVNMFTLPTGAAATQYAININWDGASTALCRYQKDASYETNTLLAQIPIRTLAANYSDDTTERFIENRSGMLSFWLTYNDGTAITLAAGDINWQFQLGFYIK